MKVVLDDTVFFSEAPFELEIRSVQRSVVQKSAAGLDGQVCIDLGLRARKLVQKGELRARSQTELQKKMDEINELIDGNLHVLKCPDGRIFENLIIENFQVDPFISGGAHVSCEYSITYTQQVY